MTPDGRYVAFHSRSSDLVLGDDNQHGDCFVRDLNAGTIRRIGGQISRTAAYSEVINPYISANGRYVSFELSEQFQGIPEYRVSLYCFDSVTGQLSNLSVPAGTYVGQLIGGGFSDDSSILVFMGSAPIIPNDSNNVEDVFVLTLNNTLNRRRPAAVLNQLGD